MVFVSHVHRQPWGSWVRPGCGAVLWGPVPHPLDCISLLLEHQVQGPTGQRPGTWLELVFPDTQLLEAVAPLLPGASACEGHTPATPAVWEAERWRTVRCQPDLLAHVLLGILGVSAGDMQGRVLDFGTLK